ncbi:hypothetical protein Sru01_62730 [Sphaerisporangium rufum]|uniref:ABC3 transporter permease C-terminal domain-containing protein n=1 Tax=Sphaerisporangium rufum TaxID=1381558 RepID=A0A919R7V8_9ACTN|nr:FtsX-like permease family protein [Sphaerisporangium rufum]GII81291.1 hypothetical protein Sru01_62730 [Sphaerisporangium rufum]
MSPRIRPPAPHWPSVRGRALADAGPLLLAAAVVAVVTLLAGAVPPLLAATADDAVRDAVRRAGEDADVLVHAELQRDDGPYGGRLRTPRLAEEVDDLRERVVDEIGPAMRAALRPPVASVSSPVLRVTDGSVLRTLQLVYLAADPRAGGGPRVTWVAGGPPGPSAAGAADPDREVPYDGPPWPVQVGLSEADAAALGVRPGDRIPLKDEEKRDKDVRVSGIFRAADVAEQAWRPVPWLLRPVPGVDGTGTTRLGALLSRDSLPDARLAFEQQDTQRTVRFSPDPGRLTTGLATSITANVVNLKAESGSSGDFTGPPRWQTRLDAVLRDAGTQIAAGYAQASVLLAGVLAAAVLVLLLAADLLVRRRGPALAAARRRGAGLPDLGSELLLESTAVTLAAAAAGFLVAGLVAPGVAWGWAVPVVLAAVAAGPGFGTLAAARATGDRRVPANRSARRWNLRTAQLRRGALEAAVLVAAVAALVALRQRGILPPGGGGDPAAAAVPAAAGSGTDGGTLPASAPALGVLAGALVLLRLLPAGTGLALRRSLRSRRPLAVFGAARAAATSARALPLLVMVTGTALATFALTLAATAERGLADGAWRTVGADARLDALRADAAATAALARRIGAAPGVRLAVAGQVTDGARVAAAGSVIVSPRLVVVDAAAYRELLATTPLPDAPDLARLGAPAAGGVPVLVRSGDGGMRPGMRMELRRDGGAPAIPLAAVGDAPAVDGADDVVLVDAAALAAAGLPVAANTVWATGPGAARAVAANAAGADAVSRENVLRARRDAPLTAGLLRLARAAAVVLSLLGLLGLVVGAAASAPERWRTLTRLRTLGLRPRDARWVAAGELLPAVLAAAVAGPLLGLLFARLTLGPLALRLLTGQPADPVLVPPWWPLAVVAAALPVAVAVLVPAESALRRRRRMSEVLRAGEG